MGISAAKQQRPFTSNIQKSPYFNGRHFREKLSRLGKHEIFGIRFRLLAKMGNFAETKKFYELGKNLPCPCFFVACFKSYNKILGRGMSIFDYIFRKFRGIKTLRISYLRKFRGINFYKF